MSAAPHVVNMNRETYEWLKRVQRDMSEDMGFVPTLGQVVRHLINHYYKEA